MKAGDIIPIDFPELVTVTANRVPMFKARLGQSNGALAAKIEERIVRSKNVSMMVDSDE
jgi:flagellar motor switch protein FliM